MIETNIKSHVCRYLRRVKKIPPHHIPVFGAVIHLQVPIVRDINFNLYQNDKRWKVDICACGGIDLRSRLFRPSEYGQYASSRSYGSSFYNFFSRSAPDVNQKSFVEDTKKKKFE